MREAVARARFVRVSPMKARLVINEIRGKPVAEAKRILAFSPKKAARIIKKVLDSAVANAQHNFELDPDRLWVVKAFVETAEYIKGRGLTENEIGKIERRVYTYVLGAGFRNIDKESYRKLAESKGFKKITEIFPINSVGIVTSRDTFVIDFRPESLKNRILQFINLSQPEELIAQTFKLKNKRNWNINDARKSLSNIDNINDYIKKILYRPFDERYVFYHKDVIERMRYDVMRHILEGRNIGLITIRRSRSDKEWNFAFVSNKIIAGATAITSLDINYLFPLYLYPDEDKKSLVDQHQTEREPNISSEIFEKLATTYGRKPTPEDILYYIYAVFYSNIYREKYAEFLKIDFPRVPFTANCEIFERMGELGKELVDLHLLRSQLLDVPIAKYRGRGDNNKIEKVKYDEARKRIYINDDKYFDNVAPEVWNYHIGGYQVLRKHLKDRN